MALLFSSIVSSILLLQANTISSYCTTLSEEEGIIFQNFTVTGNGLYMHCWKILNPLRKQIRVHVRQFNFYGKPCGVGDLRIRAETDEIDESVCGNNTNKPPFVSSSDIEIHIFINAHYYSRPNNEPNFEVHYEMERNISSTPESPCTEIINKKGIISQLYTVTGSGLYTQCWKIKNHEKNNIRLEVRHFNFYNKSCHQANLKITDEWDSKKNTGLEEMFCKDTENKGILISNTEVEIRLSMDKSFFVQPYNNPSFDIYFEIVAIRPPCCTDIYDKTGTISGNYTVAGSGLFWHCWHILNPLGHYIHMQIQQYNFYNKHCGVGDLRIVSLEDGEDEVICGYEINKSLISKSNDVVLIMFINAHYFSKPNNTPNFQLRFEMDAENEVK